MFLCSFLSASGTQSVLCYCVGSVGNGAYCQASLLSSPLETMQYKERKVHKLSFDLQTHDVFIYIYIFQTSILSKFLVLYNK